MAVTSAAVADRARRVRLDWRCVRGRWRRGGAGGDVQGLMETATVADVMDPAYYVPESMTVPPAAPHPSRARRASSAASPSAARYAPPPATPPGGDEGRTRARGYGALLVVWRVAGVTLRKSWGTWRGWPRRRGYARCRSVRLGHGFREARRRGRACA